jgi:hypothetical protein
VPESMTQERHAVHSSKHKSRTDDGRHGIENPVLVKLWWLSCRVRRSTSLVDHFALASYCSASATRPIKRNKRA